MLLSQIVVWLQVVADHGDFFEGLSDDPLAVALHSTPSGRARRIPNQLKEGVARMAAARKLGRPGQKVLELVKRFKYFNQNSPLTFKIGNKWVEPSLRRYLEQFCRPPCLLYCLGCNKTQWPGLAFCNNVCGQCTESMLVHTDDAHLVCWKNEHAILRLVHAEIRPSK